MWTCQVGIWTREALDWRSLSILRRCVDLGPDGMGLNRRAIVIPGRSLAECWIPFGVYAATAH